MTQNQKAETKLYTSIAIAAVQGNQVSPGNFAILQTEGDIERPHVCLCGAVLVAAGIPFDAIDEGGMRGVQIIRKVAKRLGITVKEAGSLNNGFEDAGKTHKYVVGASNFDKSPLAEGVDSHWYNIGAKLRKVYDETKGDN